MRDSDEAEGRIILQDVELAMRNAPEHRAAVAAGVDNAQKAILEGRELSVTADFVDEGAWVARECEMGPRNPHTPITQGALH